MSVYLLTFHAYGPRNPAGEPRFVLRNDAPSAPGPRNRLPLADRYRQTVEQREVAFDADHQRKLIDIVMDFQRRGEYRAFGVAADDANVHALVAWTAARDAVDMRAAIKAALERGLNREFGRGAWLGEGGGARRVRNRTQFDYLLDTYLPKHCGLVWTAGQGFVREAAA